MKISNISILTTIFVLLPMLVGAQGIQWSAKSVKTQAGYNIEITADIPDSYHMYDMGPYTDDGPIAAQIQVIPDSKAALAGGLKSPASCKVSDELYGMTVGVYEGKVKFVQPVTGRKGAKVTVKVRAQACSGESCLPPIEETMTVTLH